ncbi:unnamed protein product [Thlaspi arvense]|uniref:Protein kinase domain-containing protein n=1 Tax=Thlaspi arvense TaxID=13288 RepID=A0AAU9RMP7_THLAR|nr:unnamed protein product [Thlaspi arvense]
MDKKVVLSSWNNLVPLCNWTGVTCGCKHKRVTKLGSLFRPQHLFKSFNFLKEGIPASLFNCSRLVRRNLHSNYLGQGVPSELGSLTKLVSLDLGRNNLKGKLPVSLGNLTFLKELSFVANNLEGKIPNEIARLTKIVDLEFAANGFFGDFPLAIYNLSSLELLKIIDSGFSGSLRPNFGNLLPNLQGLFIVINSFTVRDLKFLALHTNSLGGHSFRDLKFFGALTNCTKLNALLVAYNRLGSDSPTSISNLSMNIQILELQSNFISRSIPGDIGNLIGLQILLLGNNLLKGPLPTSLGKLLGLIQYSATSLGYKVSMYPTIALKELFLLLLDNKLRGTIPREIMQILPLVLLNMSNNYLSGSLPEYVGRLEKLGTFSLAYNKLSGKQPHTLGKCLSLVQRFLQGNSFDGTIPDISGLMGVKRVDFSNNKLSGSILGYLANLNLLEYLNLSVNNFEGNEPTEGNSWKQKPMWRRLGIETRAMLFESTRKGDKAFLTFRESCDLISLCWFRNRKKNKINEATFSTLGASHERISYGDLRNATDSFSTTLVPCLKHYFQQRTVVAVKVLNLQISGAMKSFMAQCESLKDSHIRHRNLVKLLTTCSSIDFEGNEFTALIFEFMPNRTLDMWLHPEEIEEIHRPSRALTLLERLNIAIDVAYIYM